MLAEVQIYFKGIGRIVNKKENVISFLVSNLEECLQIREQNLTYPLLTKKLVNFQCPRALKSSSRYFIQKRTPLN